MFKLEVIAENAVELREKLMSLADAMSADSDAGAADEAEAVPKKTAAKKPAAKKAEPKPEPEKEETKAEPTVSVEDVRAKMAEIISALGDEGPATAMGLLTDLGAKKASELGGDDKAEDRAKYIELADEAIKQAG